MVTPLFRAFRSGPRCRATRPLWCMGRGARRGLASSGALAGLAALAGSAGLPVPAAGQDPFACGADQIEVPFELTETVEMWDVPEGVESLRVIAAGGRGGAPAGQVGAAGALVASTVPVTPEATLHVIVAGQGGGDGADPNSGGGGSFVGVGGFVFVDFDNTDLLLVAGGGGGGNAEAPGGNAGLPGNNGAPGGGLGPGQGGGSNGEGGSGGSGTGAVGGDGGGARAGSDGDDAGGGVTSGGGAGAGGNGGRAGDPSLAPAMAAINGGEGGEGGEGDNNVDGGFGGGGGSGIGVGPGLPNGGGGGGFAGGGGGGVSGGGGGGSSFVAEMATDTAAEAYAGDDGFVKLCYEAPPSPPSFSKSFSPASIAPGETSTLTFIIDNSESAAEAADLAFTDTLPEGMTVADPANPEAGCTGTLTATPGEGTIEYTAGTVAAGASCTVSVEVTSTTPGAHENTSSELDSSAGTSAPAQATLEVTEVMADLSIALEAAEIGNPSAELAVTAANAGPDDATGVGVILELPECTRFDSDSCDGTFADGEWSWEIGALAADASAACTVTVEIVDCEEPPTIGATIEGDQGDPDTANNTAELTLEIEPVPALPTLALVLLAAGLTFVTLRKLRRTHMLR